MAKGPPLPPCITNYVDRLGKRSGKGGSTVLPGIIPAPEPYYSQLIQLRQLVDGPEIMAELLAHLLSDTKVSTIDKVAEAAAKEEAERLAAQEQPAAE